MITSLPFAFVMGFFFTCLFLYGGFVEMYKNLVLISDCYSSLVSTHILSVACLSFFYCCSVKILEPNQLKGEKGCFSPSWQGTHGDKGIPLWQGNQEGRSSKQLVTSRPPSGPENNECMLLLSSHSPFIYSRIPARERYHPQ